jgi:hypothetical protein
MPYVRIVGDEFRRLCLGDWWSKLGVQYAAQAASPLPSLFLCRAGVGNLFITARRVGYAYLWWGPQKKNINTAWTIPYFLDLQYAAGIRL